MKQCIYRSVLCSFVLCCLSAQEAARPSDVEEISINVLVDEALANNPELAFYRAEIDAAKGERRTAGTRANPDAEFELGRKRSSPRDGSLFDEGLAWSVSVSQTFEWPNRIALRKAIASRQIEIAEVGLAQFQRELASEVRRAAFRLLVAQEKRDVALNVAQRGEELVQALLQREPAGTSPLLESRIIEANILTLKRRINEAAKEAEAALLEVNQLRGKPIATPLRVAPVKLRFPNLGDDDAFVSLARTNSFEIKSKVVELEQQGLRVDLARNERFPSFTVRPFYSEENASEREQIAGVGLSAPLPLWNRNKGAVEAAKSRFEQGRVSLSVTQRKIERELRENLASYAIDQKEIAGWNPELIRQLQEAADLADRHYRLGSVPVSIYLEMQNKYLEAMESVLETQADALFALQRIERLTGVPLGNVAGAEKGASK
jgi:outer membrane protein, heavy metal efflux system